MQMFLYAAYNQPVKFTLTGGHQVKYPGWMLKRGEIIIWTLKTFVAMHAKINNNSKPNIMLQGINWLAAGVRVDFYSPQKYVQLLRGFFEEHMKQLWREFVAFWIWGFWFCFCGAFFIWLVSIWFHLLWMISYFFHSI